LAEAAVCIYPTSQSLKGHNVIDNQTADRGQRLKSINDQLTRRNLKKLKKLGDYRQGEFEIVDIIKFYDESKRFFTDVKFSVIMPGRISGEFTVRFNANGLVSDGSVFVVMINGKFVIVKQWRLPLQQWTYEVPSGFSVKIDQVRDDGSMDQLTISDLPVAILARELGQEIMDQATISVSHLGNIAENSGTHTSTPSNYLVQMQVPVELLDRRLRDFHDEIKLKFWDATRVVQEIGRKLYDSHTITAVSLALAAIYRGEIKNLSIVQNK